MKRLSERRQEQYRALLAPSRGEKRGRVMTEVSVARHLLAEVDRLQRSLGDLYQVLGTLVCMAGIFDTPDANRALDVASDIRAHRDLLPWPRDRKLLRLIDEADARVTARESGPEGRSAQSHRKVSAAESPRAQRKTKGQS